MMMANGGTSFDWQHEGVDFDVTADNDDGLSMDIQSLLDLLEESPPGNPLQNGLADPSLSIAACSELASDVNVNEHVQSYNGVYPFSPPHHSEAAVSRTFCSSGSSDTQKQTVNFNFMKVENQPDISSMHFTSESLGDRVMPVPCLANNEVSRNFSPFSNHDIKETNFERADSNGTFGFGDGNVYHQLMDKSGICYDSVADNCRKSEALDYIEAPFIDLNGCYDIGYETNNEFSLPYCTSLNGPSYIAPSRHSQTSDLHPMINNNGMIFDSKTEFEEHLMHSSSLNSEVNYENSGFGSYAGAKRSNSWLPSSESSSETPVSESLKFNRQNKAEVICVKDEKSDSKGLFESFSGVFNSFSKKDCVVKEEHEDTKRFLHFTNIIDKSCRTNTPFSYNCHLDLESLEKSFIQSDNSIKGERGSKFIAGNSMNSLPSKISQEAVRNSTLGNVTYIGEGDPDICILEDMSEPARKKQSLVEEKSVVTTQRSIVCPPATHLGFNNARLKTTDERFVYRVALQDLSQPKSEASPPDGALAVPLLRHQRIALSWMVQKETKSLHCFGGILADDQGLGKTISMIALILKERSPSSSVHTIETKEKTTETLNLDEDDDAVLELDKSEQNAGSSSMATNGSSTQTRSRPAAGTLVVCPTSVLRQWNDELHNKVNSKANLSVLVYHGGNRTKDPSELAKYDVVLTTYAIVSMEVPKQPLVDEGDDETKRRGDFETVGLSSGKRRKDPPTSGKSPKKGKMDNELFESLARPLAKVRWFRVILDEAQSIKNHKTQVARACWGLRAKRRWCLSGTPIQNAIDDLYSYFRFLKYDPYAVYKSFCSTIKAPIQRSPKTGYKKLQAVLKTIMLRRTKGSLLDGEPIISLPPKTVNLKKVEFTAEERDFYRRLEADSRAQFEEYAAAGTVKQNYVNILLMLLRLRQACDHPLLVGGSGSKSDWKSSVDKAKKLSQEKRSRLLNCLEASLAICGICSDPPEDAVVTTCEHVFCNQCILEHLSSDDSHCPSSKCKTLLTKSSVFTKSTLVSVSDSSPDQSSSKSEVLDPCSSNESINSSKIEAAEALDSSKIKAALQVLQSIANPIANCAEKSSNDLLGVLENDTKVKENSVVREKAIVFSQWTRMLDLLEACLKDSNIGYRRLDGTMSVLARDKAVKDFNSLPEVTVMIMSLKAASLGLNMVAACHVLLLDLWWNPTTEDQAIDRAHRIGQTRPVTVLRLTVKDTVEDRILALQRKKREMVSSAFGEDETGSRQTRLTVDDLKYLFQA